MYTISVITPSYNQGIFIEECLASVVAQSFRPLEHLIYDPGSSDDSIAIINNYRSVDLFEEPDNGQAHAINKGLNQAKGDIIAWINADDYYYDGKVFAMISERFSNADAPDIIYGKGRYVDQEGKALKDAYINRSPETLPTRLHREVGILQPSLFFKRDIIQRIGLLDEALNFCMDYDYWIRAVKHHLKFAFIDVYLSFARLYPENKTIGKRGDSYIETCNTVMKHFGYVHPAWIRRLAEYSIEGFDGVISYSNEQQPGNTDLIDLKYIELLSYFNQNPLTINRIQKNLSQNNYSTIYNELIKYNIDLSLNYREVNKSDTTKDSGYIFRIEDSLLAFKKKWVEEQNLRTNNFLNRLSDRKPNQICVIIGNGKIAGHNNLALLKDVSVIISDYAFLDPELFSYATFFTCVDYRIARDEYYRINPLTCLDKIFPYWMNYFIKEANHTYFIRSFEKSLLEDGVPLETLDFNVSLLFNLSVAYAMGFKTILLIGFGTEFRQAGMRDRMDAPPPIGLNLKANHQQNENNPNRFAKRPDMNLLYSIVKRKIESEGRYIFNCTDGNDLKIFRRSSLKAELDPTIGQKSILFIRRMIISFISRMHAKFYNH